MQTIYNATGCELKEYRNFRAQLKNLIKNENIKSEDFIGTKFENLLLLLTKYRLFLFVYILNRKVLKYRYNAFPITTFRKGINYES